MAIHVRNLKLGAGSAQYLFWARGLVAMRELFLAGRWTDSAFQNQTEYDNNIITGPSDCQVDEAEPRKIYSPSGGFTGYSNYALTLLGTNDENRGVFRIDYVVDDNTVMIENPPPTGWVDETGISSRIFNWGDTDPIANNNYMIMLAPSGPMKARLQHTNGYTLNTYVYPDGANLAASDADLSASYTDVYAYINAFFDGTSAIFVFRNGGAIVRLCVWGTLEGAVSADTYPNFMLCNYWYHNQVDDLYQDSAIYMINSTTFAQETWYLTALIRAGDQIANVNTRRFALLGARSVNGKAKLTKPWLYNPFSSGGYFRGKLPHIRMTHEMWEPMRFMSAARTWIHLTNGLCIPGGGPGDVHITE